MSILLPSKDPAHAVARVVSTRGLGNVVQRGGGTVRQQDWSQSGTLGQIMCWTQTGKVYRSHFALSHHPLVTVRGQTPKLPGVMSQLVMLSEQYSCCSMVAWPWYAYNKG